MRRLTFAALACVVALGCAEQRDLIDRTQPNAVDKALFQGEWYYQQTVVDIPGTWSHTFVGETNWLGMERVRWDIQEDWLYARRAYERIQNAEGGSTPADANPDGTPYLGAILAAYRIESHFDIKRAYNPSTGEEYNVLEENTSDRPWYDRQYMRVDWSRNQATEFMFLADDVAQDPVTHYVQDVNDPDYPVFDPGEFDGDVMVRQPYIDITNTVMTQPGMTYFPELGESYPTCWLFSRATSDCTTEPIKVRNSFLRLNPNREYVAKPFKGSITDYFGLFTQDRLVFDPEYEVNERKRERYAQLHNLWLEWLDENGDVITDPAARGGIRPMVYYVHNWPESLEEELRTTEAEWNRIFQRAAGAAMGRGPVDDTVFKACHWPLREVDDPTVCVPAGYEQREVGVDAEGQPVTKWCVAANDDECIAFNPRLGDIRYNWIAFVPDYYDGFALLGLGPSNTDPLTGQVISAGAYLYVYNDIVTRNTTDMIMMLKGDLDPAMWADGRDIDPWIDYMAREGAAGGTMARRTVSQEEIQAYANAINMDWAEDLTPATPEQLSQFNGRPMDEVVQTLAPVIYDQGLFNGTMDDSEGRLMQLKDTYFEDLLINEEIKLAAGIMPGSPLGSFTNDMLRDASVARLGPIKVMEALRAKKEYFANVRNVDLMEMRDDGYQGLANLAETEGWDEDQIFDFVRGDTWHAVLAHELGHSFNLHHNFGGTEDVLNYKDEYWQLRDDGTVGPRWQDPITQAEIDGRIYAYAYSSIMDYSRLTLDAFGPGKYDEAAVIMGYGDKVEYYLTPGSVPLSNFHDWATSDGQIIIFYFPQPEAFHYTEWFRGMGHMLHDQINRELIDVSMIDWNLGITTDTGRPRVPYIFCSPYQSDIGNGCFTRDFGADEYERTVHHIDMANTWYVSRSFVRYAVGADPMDYVGRSYGRLYRRLKGYNDYYALIVGLLKSFGFPDSGINGFLTDETTGWGAYTIAEHDLVNFLLSTITTPDVNGFDPITDAAGETYLAVSPFNFTQGRTNILTGRYFTTAWWDAGGGDECGMYWWECLHHYGFYLDKIMALEALTDSNTYFVARDTAEDVREWRISFFDNFAPQINSFMGGILSQDYENGVAPHYVSTTDIRYPDYVLGDIPTTGTPIDPGAGFTVQLYAAVLGMARFQNNFDKSFLHSSRMWLAGSGFAIDNEFGYVEYEDPINGARYRAINYPGGTGVAQRMINRANTVLSRSHYCTSGCQAVSEDDRNRADAELVRFGQVLDVMVDLTGYYETYTQGYGDPYNPGGIP